MKSALKIAFLAAFLLGMGQRDDTKVLGGSEEYDVYSAYVEYYLGFYGDWKEKLFVCKDAAFYKESVFDASSILKKPAEELAGYLKEKNQAFIDKARKAKCEEFLARIEKDGDYKKSIEEAIADYFAVNNSKEKNLNILERSEKVKLLDEKDYKANIYGKYKEYERKKYPGFVRFSRIGFNKEKDTAFLCVSSVQGPRWGNGMYEVLKKKDGKWRVEFTIGIWRS